MFKPGDTVKLITGGPPMIVESTSVLNVFCIYFDQDQVLRHDTFRASDLQLTNERTIP